MKLIIAGSRTGITEEYFLKVIKNQYWIKTFPWEDSNSEIYFGDAKSGVDLYAETYCITNKLQHQKFVARWDIYGNTKAGIIRNREMADCGTHLIAIWNGISTGTKNMIQESIARGLAISIYIPSNVDVQKNLVAFRNIRKHDQRE